MFTTFYCDNYQPLSWLSLALDYRLWGADPAGYHLTNAFIHSVSAVVFYFVGLLLLGLAAPDGEKNDRAIAAGFAALLFSIHPLRVESVAWLSERRDVLSVLFYLLTILAYLRAVSSSEPGRFRLALVAYVLACLSKGSVITLPAALIILDVYPLRRLTADPRRWINAGQRAVLIEKFPFAAAAVATAVVGVIAQRQAGAVVPLRWFGVGARLLQAAYGLAFYPWKSLAPFQLSPFYEVPLPFNPGAWPFVAACAVVTVVGGVLAAYGRRWPGGRAVILFFAVTVSPMLGLVKLGSQLAADRYSYLSCLGFALLAGAGLLKLLRRARGPIRGFVLAAAGLVLAGLGRLSWVQCGYWHDTVTLWTRAIYLEPDNPKAHLYLAAVADEQGRLDAAVEYSRSAAHRNPYDAMALADYAVALDKVRRAQEALPLFREALRLEPGNAAYHNSFALVLAEQGELDEAVAEFRRAIELRADEASFRYNLAVNLARQGRADEAIGEYQEALRLAPDGRDARSNLGLLLQAKGQSAQAAAQYRLALQSDSRYALAAYNWANLLSDQGRLDAAERLYRGALRADPALVESRFNWANTLARLGRYGEAAGQYREVLRRDPAHAAARRYLALVLALSR